MIKKVKNCLYRMLFETTKSDSLITVCIFVLLLFALIFSTSASMNTSTTPVTTIVSLVKQLLFTIVGLIGYRYMMVFFDSFKVKNHILVIVGVEFVLLMVAFVMSYLKGGINGNYSWIILPFGMTIQPSEFAKIVVILLVSCLIADRKFKNISAYACFRIPIAIMLGLVLFIAIFGRDMGSALICLFIGCICLLIPDNSKMRGLQTLLITMALIGVGCFYFFLLTEKGGEIITTISTTIGARFRAVRNPSYSDDATREIFYSLLGISKGSIFGVGLGNSVQKFGYLVSSAADYVFPVIVEETGLLGIVLVFVPYILIIYELLHYCKKVQNETDRVILVGVVSYLFLHFFFNIGGVSGLIPLTGVPLLFLSRGGTSLVATMLAMGMAQSVISKYENEKDKIKMII